MEIDLYQGISDSDKINIPELVSDKLQERWKTKCHETEKIKEELEKYKTNNEQEKFELEQKVVLLKQQFEKEGEARVKFEKKASEGQDRISDLEKEVQKLNTQNATYQCQLQITKSESESMSSTSVAISGALEVKNRLIQELKVQIADLEKQVSSAMRAKAEAQIQSEEAASLQSQLQYKEKRLSQERSLLRGQVELLQEQLEKRVQEALHQHNEHSSATLQLQQDLSAANTECRLLKETHDQLQKTAEEKSKRVEELLETLKDARENELKLEESFRMELSAQQKLVTIYLTSSEDRKAQCAELERGVSELRSLLQEASQQYGALERGKEQQAKDADEEIQKREELIHDLRDELDKVNMLLEASAKKEEENALFSLTPAASAASQLMSKGLTLSQLYAEHLTATDKLMKLEEENARLTRYIDQILQEIEERAPILQKQREEYMSAMKTVAALQQQLDDNEAAARTIREEGGELERRCKYLMREQESLTSQNADLGRQVTVLLTQVEAARAGLPPPMIDADDGDASGAGSAGAVVNAQLVCFRDVSELQQQNQKLLHTVRHLGEQAEEAEKKAFDRHVQDIQAELSEAKHELEELRVGRDRIEALVENIGRQRDMYRSLLTQQQGRPGQQQHHHRDVPNMDDDSRPPSAGASDCGADTAALLQQLRDDNTKITKEYDAAKKALAAAQESLKQANTKLQEQQKEAAKQAGEMRNTLEKTRSQNVKLLSHAEYNEERLKTLQGNCESYQRQVNGLEEKTASLQSIVSRHEATIDHIRGENMSLVKKLSHAEVSATMLREEKLIFKEVEARLLAEREAASRQQSSQALLLASLESIKNNLEHKDTTDRMRMQNSISDLTDQNTRLKAKLEANTDVKEARAKVRATEERLAASERERATASSHVTAAREQLQVLQTRYDEALAREKQATLQLRELQAAGEGQQDTSTGPSAAAVRHLEVQLVEERARVSSLERSLEQCRQSLTSLQTTCTQQEKELKQSSNAAVASLKQIEDLGKGKNDLERQVASLEDKLQQLQEQTSCRIEELSQRLQQSEEDVVSSRDLVEAARVEMDEAKKIEANSRKIIEDAQKEALSVQQKYEREVMLHGTDLQALAKLKEQLASHTQDLEKVTVDKLKAEETLDEVRNAGTSLQDALKRERDGLKERVTELEEQNKSLLEQFTQLSDKMAAIQSKIVQSQDGNESLGNASFTEDEARTSDQLREVVRYLRRERELATGRCDVAQAEATRLRAQWESSVKHAKALTQELTTERESKQVSMDTASRYGELLRKVHTMDALADSNRLLRQEKDALQEKAAAAASRLQALQAQVEPLSAKMAEATADIETLQVEKGALEKDVEMYKKRTQDLVEKLNRAKPEDFLRMQQELAGAKSTLQGKEADVNRLRMQNAQLQKNVQTMVTTRQGLQQQLNSLKEESSKMMEDNKKLGIERSRLVSQVATQQERIAAIQTAQHQEELKQLEQRNQLLQQLSEVKQREEAAKGDTDALRKELESASRRVEDSNAKLVEADNKNAELQKANGQLRKIATKYKNAVVSGEEEGTSAKAKVKELEDNIATLQQQLDEANKTGNREQEDASRAKLMEAELMRLRHELDARSKETLALRGAVNKQLGDISKRLDESNVKKLAYESRISQLEKEKEQLSAQLETLSLKLNVQQRQIMMDSATRQKQAAPVASKPSTSGSSGSDKSLSEAPPTANIKPLAAAAPSVTMSSPRATPTPTPPCRTIPTASIRPLAPPPTSSLTASATVSRDAHSEGLVSSSTVTLPQATVTPTPATPTATLPTTATTSTTQPTSATQTSTCTAPVTLTATVPPTPAVPASLGSPAVVVSAGKSIATAGPPSQQQAAPLAIAAPSVSIGPPSGAAIATPGPSTSAVAAVVATVAPQEVAEAMDEEGGAGRASEQLVSQAIALILPSQDALQLPTAGPSSQKRKRDGVDDDEEIEEDESKRCRVEQEAPSDSVSDSSNKQPQQQQEMDDATSSSSQPAEAQPAGQDQDVILVDSDQEGESDQALQPQQPQQLRRPAERMEESEAEERQQQQPQVEDDQEQQQDVAEAPSESHQPLHSNGSVRQQPSSSSAGHREAALVMPRASASNDRVGSSGHGSQHCDETSSDGTAPATPSLFGTRRQEGFPEPVSSPQRGAVPPTPHSPAADGNSETGVSTSDASSNSARADSAAGGPSQQQHHQGPCSQEQPSGGGHYTEADSMAAEVEEVDDEEEVEDDEEEVEDEDENEDEECPENGNEDEEDEVVEVHDDEDDDDQSREAQQQPGEAAQHKSGGDDVSSGGEERESGPSSSSYAAPSSSSSSVTAPASPSSSSRRITPITWDRATSQEQVLLAAGRGRGPYRSSDRILGRRQQQQQQLPAAPEGSLRGAFGAQRSSRGGQRARRSRQYH